jgi:hypothetical protein
MRKKRGFTIAIKVKSRTGHVPRQTGAGAHEDRRTKRNRTRAEQNRNAVQDQNKTEDAK